MKKIFKYPLGISDSEILELPQGAQILTVQSQNNTPCLWALVNPNLSIEKREFETFGTGHEMVCGDEIKRKYIGTYQLSGGALVFHVFERL